MDGVFSQELRLKNRDVDMYRRLRTSRLFELLQEAAIAHTEALGMGREKTLDRGLLWVVTLQRAEIARMPEYDEKIRVEGWPGETMHVLFPRYYRIVGEGGGELVRASALWMLVDEKSRRFVFPERFGIAIGGVETGRELPLPTAPAAMATDGEREFSVPYSYVDLNGHMNNTRYFDLAEDCVGAAAEGRELHAVATEYKAEARLGDRLFLRWGGDGDRFFLSGGAERPVFTISLEYRKKI
ncbi:MAG: hypothetical protein IJH47_08275 [Oscillospiraceae bacterium]|nr:hypothetical protein [Oscillospiraceae bacterium]